ncbi:MAG: hypothetical protein HY720_08485 [Planctomycetes bacterium]|nr:hypothetical protein [Planctomycetota bacterium]
MSQGKHVVAIVGAAVAGSEAASVMADRGILSVVFDQNPRPFGKIEDGLPRWHVKQRKKEYEKISAKLARPEISFVPLTTLGKDLPFEELLRGWGFSAVLLANGAWRDRPLPVEGVDAYAGKGLVYQNPFVYWFNHFTEKNYRGEQYPILDNVAVIGGGLASIDVVKILQIELTRRALASRGIEVEMLEFEKKGIPKVLESKGLSWGDLGLKGCTLFYRRRVQDMPLAEYPDGADEKAKEKTHQIRARILENCREKFLFQFHDQHLPTGPIVEGGRLVGLKFVRTQVVGGKAQPLPGTEFDHRTPMILSSIGSVPGIISGLAMKGETYEVEDWDTGKIKGYEHLWGLGNVVTGKGNIQASLKHGSFVAGHVASTYLGVSGEADGPGLYAAQEAAVQETAGKIAAKIGARPVLAMERVEAILERARSRQRQVGYDGNLAAWLAKVTPPDME